VGEHAFGDGFRLKKDKKVIARALARSYILNMPESFTIHKTCPYCGKPFVDEFGMTIYCTGRCKQNAQRKRKRERELAVEQKERSGI